VNCNTRAFRWTAEEGMVTLPLLGGSTGGATAITADGSVIVGWAREGMTGYSVAVLWTADGQVIPLGGLPGYSSGSTAAAVSADGSVVVGRCFSSEWQLGNQAFRWTAQTGMVGLGDLPGGDFFSISTAVSADGSVVVGYSLAASGWQAFRWTPAEGMVALGNLPGGDIYSFATGLTADGSVIVGAGRLQGSYPYFDQPFIWEAINGMRDFQGFLVNDLSLDLTACGYSWNLSGATAVSADGSTIVGYGLNPVAVATGMVDNEEGWIARISLPPVAGDIDGDGDADMDDVNVFVKVLLGLDTDLYHVAASDINLSGTADGRDIQPFVNLLLTP
jgi:probable HAF family extracellular repeat protein